ncbi:hypothetical protein FA13DRAFT_1833004 [Coprinellus micaceus]|uniref:Uncharacterized protein n=1 Tax=Coprinellus micaceus TaxID=71717 RepID=A0A4Y7SHC6_COPMI|nr:hypothetical protein FA13DRAFT_1833004 [Coprinellus micaceus]
MAANTAVRALEMSWRSSKPRNARIVELTERLTRLVAVDRDADTAIIRYWNPSTQKVDYIKTKMHLTGFVLKKGENTGYAFHYYVDDQKEGPLPSTPEWPNPQVWELKSRNNTGFTFPDGEEIRVD